MTKPNIHDSKINEVVGGAVKFSWKKPRTSGSPGLFIKSFKNRTNGIEQLRLDSRCNFEKRIGGLVLYSNFHNQPSLLLLPEKDILRIKITRGAEEIRPIPFYPMWILMKFGVPVSKARYFGLRGSQYSIEQMKLEVKTNTYDIDFVANGYLFERHLIFFKSLDYGNKLEIIAAAKT